MALVLHKIKYITLENPGAEAGSSSVGWTIHTTGHLEQNGTAYTGDWSFVEYGGAWNKVYQRFNIGDHFGATDIARGTTKLDIGAVIRPHDTNGQAYLGARFLDSTSTEIYEVGETFVEADYEEDEWHEVSASFTVPGGTHYVDIVIGLDDDINMDDVTCPSIRLYLEGTSSATLPTISAAGSVVLTKMPASGDGDVDLPAMTAAGDINEPYGENDLPFPSVSATATPATTFGAITLGPLDATGTSGVWANAAIELEPLEVDITTGHQVSIELPVAVMSASCSVDVVGSATLSIPPHEALAYTGHQIVLDLPAVTASATARSSIVASATLALRPLSMLATDAGDVLCSGNTRLMPLTVDGAGEVQVFASGTVTVPVLSAAAGTAGMVVGSASISIPALTAATTLSHVPVGVGSLTLPALQMGGDSGGGGFHSDSTAKITGRFDDYVLQYVRPS